MLSDLSKRNFILLARSWDNDYVAIFGRQDESGEDYFFLEMFRDRYYFELGKKKWKTLNYTCYRVYDVWYNDLVQ